VGMGVRVHAVEPVRISLEERLLGILRHEDSAPGDAAAPGAGS
jgi:ABC-2 type transport system ATP-binding protein